MSHVHAKPVLAVVCLAAAGLLAASGGFAANGGSLAELSPVKQDGKAVAKPAEPQRDKRLLAQFMRAKLTASTQVLEGLCTEDFALIGKGARNLKKLSSAERWRVSNDVMFRQHSAEFQTDVDKLLKAAEKKQIDSAALAWTKTTLDCIECHRWVRATLIADGPRLDGDPFAVRK